MSEERACLLCKKVFFPSKYRPNQTICSDLECQYRRQLKNMKDWRERNPYYFKYKEIQDVKWKEVCRERAKKWRENHVDYLKLYREEHKERYRNYMRLYMRTYRKKILEKAQENAQKNVQVQEPEVGADPTAVPKQM